MKVVDNRYDTKTAFRNIDYTDVFIYNDMVFIAMRNREVHKDAMSSGYVNALCLDTGDTSYFNDETIVEHCPKAVLLLDDGSADRPLDIDFSKLPEKPESKPHTQCFYIASRKEDQVDCSYWDGTGWTTDFARAKLYDTRTDVDKAIIQDKIPSYCAILQYFKPTIQ